MVDQLIVDAAKPFLDVGIVGAICVVLAAVIVWQNRVHRTEMREEREAHQRTREAHIAALQTTLALGESMRASQSALDATIDQFIEFTKDILHERGRA